MKRGDGKSLPEASPLSYPLEGGVGRIWEDMGRGIDKGEKENGRKVGLGQDEWVWGPGRERPLCVNRRRRKNVVEYSFKIICLFYFILFCDSGTNSRQALWG